MGYARNHRRSPAATLPKIALAGMFALGFLAACDPPSKLTPQEAADATQATEEVTAPDTAIVASPYRTYRWLRPQEVAQRIGYDATMDAGTRYEVEQTIDDELARKGYQKGEPADFTVAFSDTYIESSTVTVVGIIDRNPEEKFTVVFFDAQTGRLLWRGWGKEDLSSDQLTQEETLLAVTNALDDMPVPLGP